VGDAAFQKKCLGRMGDVAREGRTVLFVSHNMGAIRSLCQRVLLLDKGALALDETTDLSIARYLDQNLVEGAIASAEDIQTHIQGVIKRNNPFIRFQKIAILDRAGFPRNSFYSDEDIRVSVTFECLQQVRDLRVLVCIVDENNVSILETQNLDDSEIISNFNQLEPGHYNASCTLPANTFGGKTFFLTVHLIYPKIEHLHVDKILEFTVTFKGYNNVQYGSGADAFLRPQLNWILQQNH
jgi:lipopolysaccharide transport system ATP-binding protein